MLTCLHRGKKTNKSSFYFRNTWLLVISLPPLIVGISILHITRLMNVVYYTQMQRPELDWRG